MNSLFEQQRQLHADLDFLVRNASQALVQNTSKKDELLTEAYVSQCITLHQHKSKQLLQLYQDNSKQQELYAITTTSNDCSEFYTCLKDIKKYYNTRPNEFVQPSDLESGYRDFEKEQLGRLIYICFL
jgi:hypothetical protein